ncbi:hypothetical protein ABZV64_02540 [Streptomyces sp. NPDC004959]|uniref:hypothetical protein n=1 Tax=Streptomyces sp. NPDC004959 TaxID=3154673 RepID=UPI0033B378D1
MSRDTESSSSGPRGSGGGAAYPSGTPPYGTPAQGEDGAAAPQDAAASGAGRSEERRTETTMTTRIKINIPGSRPIPPVVLRTPMSDREKEERAARGEDTGPPQGGAPQGRERSRPAPVPPPPGERDGGQGPAERPGPSGQPARPGPAGASGQTAGGGAPREDKPPSDWFAPRKNGTRGGNTPSPVAPSQGGGTEGAGLPGGGTQGAGVPGTPGAPRAAGAPGASGGSAPAAGGYGAQTPAAGTPLGRDAGRQQPPQSGRSTGAYDVTQAFADAPPQATPRAGGPQSGGPQAGAGPAAGASEAETTAQHPAPGTPRSPWPSVDDTAILTPQQLRAPGGPSGGPGEGGAGGSGNGGPGSGGASAGQVSGDTLTGGLPVVPPRWESDQGGDRVTMRQDPLGPGAGSPSFPVPGAAARFPEPVTSPAGPEQPSSKAAKSAKPKKKGRSKLGLLLGAVVVIAAGGYGAGLLMNRSDVPKGTTVLGVDIGGGTRDEAVNKLDSALAKRSLTALPLSVDGKAVSLKPDKSGLSLDTQATVRGAATSDYNPVSVFGSLVGKERVVDPVMPVDKEKLADSLSRVAGTSGSLREGTIKFSPGKATPVHGKPGRTLDVDKSMDIVARAYRDQVEAGATKPVSLPLTEHKPEISDAEVDRMMKDFAEPAMSGLVTIKAGTASIQFGPDRSLPQILGVKAVGGKLVDTYDLKALETLYGSTFDGVLITRGTGEKTAVTPQDVVGALREALRGKTAAERTVEIKTNPS